MFFFHLLPCPFDLLFTFVSLSFPSLDKTLHGISWLCSWFKSFLDFIDHTSPREDYISSMCGLVGNSARVPWANRKCSWDLELDGLHQREKRQLFFSLQNVWEWENRVCSNKIRGREKSQDIPPLANSTKQQCLRSLKGGFSLSCNSNCKASVSTMIHGTPGTTASCIVMPWVPLSDQ